MKMFAVRSLVFVLIVTPAAVFAPPVLSETALLYKAPGILYLGSRRPIPAQHVRCLKFVDDYYKWRQKGLRNFGQLPPNNGKFKAEQYKRAVAKLKDDLRYQLDMSDVENADFGVLDRRDAVDMLEEKPKQIAEAEAKFKESQREFEDNLNEHPIIVELNRRLMFFAQADVKLRYAYKAYAECVLENNLPATDKN